MEILISNEFIPEPQSNSRIYSTVIAGIRMLVCRRPEVLMDSGGAHNGVFASDSGRNS